MNKRRQQSYGGKDSGERRLARAKKPTDFKTYWANGLRFTTDDRAFDIHIGGRTQVDIADAEPNNNLTHSAQGKFSERVQ